MSSEIQGSLLPVGVGTALTERRRPVRYQSYLWMMEQWNNGTRHCIRKIWDIPVVFVPGNIRIAQTTKICDAHSGDIAQRATCFGIKYSLKGFS